MPEMTNAELIRQARKVLNSKEINGNKVGDVGAALVSGQGNVYAGVCLDSGSGLGFCAERAAVAQMFTQKEYKVVKIAAVWNDNPDKDLYVLPPCGARREFMKNLCEDGLDIDVVLGRDKTVKLRDLLPHNEWPEKEAID